MSRGDEIAEERMRILLEQARRQAREGRLDRAHRYAERILTLGQKHNVPLPREAKPFVCRECHGFLFPGETSRVRTRDRRVVTTCLRCGTIRRHPFREEVGRRRR